MARSTQPKLSPPQVTVFARTDAKGRTYHVAKWRDPATDTYVPEIRLEHGERCGPGCTRHPGITTAKQRERWKAAKQDEVDDQFRELRKRRGLAKQRPAAAVQRDDLRALAEQHIEDKTRKHAGTGRVARPPIEAFLRFCEARRINRAAELDGPTLADWRREVDRSKPAVYVARIGPRGGRQRVLVEKPQGYGIGPLTKSKWLGIVGTFLRSLLPLRLLAQVDREDLRVILKHESGLQQIADEDDKRTPLTGPEVELLLRAALDQDATGVWKVKLAAPFLLQVLTGLRPGELSGLQWSHVKVEPRDYEKDRLIREPHLALPRALTKNAKRRAVTLSCAPAAIELLRRLRAARGPSRDGLVFPDLVTGADTRYGKKAGELRDLVQLRGGGLPPDFTPHSLRTTSGCVQVNTPGLRRDSSQVAREFGHTTQTAERYYWQRWTPGDPDAATIEDALQITGIATAVIDAVGPGAAQQPAAKVG